MLKIELKLFEERSQARGAELIHYDAHEFDCEMGVLGAICDLLEERKLAEFFVCGFGEEKWPVDVGIDLCTIIEELPTYCRRVMNAEKTIELDFYEQGMERSLAFFDIGAANISVECRSRTTWQPDPSVEFLTTQELHEILAGLGRNFQQAVFLFFPLFARSPLLKDFWIVVEEFARFSETARTAGGQCEGRAARCSRTAE